MYEYKGKVVGVVDGDTYDINVDLGFRIYHTIRVRLKDVDTPEVYGKNACEEGRLASEYVKNVLFVAMQPDVRICTYKDVATSFNRYVADVFCVSDDGKEYNLADMIVESGHGVRV